MENKLVEDIGSQSSRDFYVGKPAWERGGQGWVGMEEEEGTCRDGHVLLPFMLGQAAPFLRT